ncbi:hypothetical protein Tco_1043561 [Tanacetum coccineum]|uniref:Uncharacterized protein n=1 Tax=Tanacetum coccineum TaxID=301880 RepID=A0ABQ5GMF6_9ASTR
MAKTMEQYMRKTQADYGSGVARPKIKDKDNFELKGQFLKELRTNTFIGSDHEDANEHIEKVPKIVDLFHIPNITIDQVMLRAFPMSLTRTQEPDENLYQAWESFKGILMKCPQHYLTEMQEMPKQPSKKWLNTLKNGTMTSRGRSTETSDRLAAIQAQLNNLGREINKVNEKVYAAQVGLSLDPFSEDYIELNDLNEPFELRRNQGDDLMPTIEEGEVIEEFRTRDEDLDTEIDDYPSYCDDDKKIHIDCAHNLKFSCMIGFEFTHANFFPLLYVNMMSRKFHNSIMKNKMVYKGNNVVGALMNVPIFVGTFFVMTDFAVLEDMDAYRDNEMGDIIFGEPFLREVGIKTKRFEGIITLYNGDNEVTYQMVRSHPKFKHHTNEQCNKIPPLLKVSEKGK